MENSTFSRQQFYSHLCTRAEKSPLWWQFKTAHTTVTTHLTTNTCSHWVCALTLFLLESFSCCLVGIIGEQLHSAHIAQVWWLWLLSFGYVALIWLVRVMETVIFTTNNYTCKIRSIYRLFLCFVNLDHFILIQNGDFASFSLFHIPVNWICLIKSNKQFKDPTLVDTWNLDIL